MLRQRISFAFLLTCLLCSLIHAQSKKPLSISLITGTTTTSPAQTTSTSSQATITSGQSLVSQNSQISQSGSGSVGSQQSNAPSAYSSVSVNPVDPPGGVTMLTPAASAASSTYYKIGTTVTFSWSYTSVQVTPTAVNVEAYCAVNKYPQRLSGADWCRFYYPVAENISFDETQVLWDTEAYDANATQPLLTFVPVSLYADLVQCIPCIYSTRIEVSLLSRQLDTLDHFLDSPLVYTSHKHIPLYPVSSFKSSTNSLATICVICSSAPRMLIPRGMWWSLGLCAAFVIGGWRVVAG